MYKLRVAFISLTSCEGCLYNILDNRLLNLVNKHNIKIAYWRLIGLKEEDTQYDVAIVEGSVTSEEEIETLKDVRSRSRVLIALGSCAVLGGIQAGANPHSRPLNEYVKVDYYIRGCPANASDVIYILEKIARGIRPMISEKRFELIERDAPTISDGFLYLDSSKCIVCGRCIELCRLVGASILGYIYRGMSTFISTPYQEPFNKSGCIYCGLCAAYCPAGAIQYTVQPYKALEYLGGAIYIEPEALVALAETEELNLGQVVSAFKVLGFSEVVVYSALNEAVPGKLYARSPAELAILNREKRFVGMVNVLEPKIPAKALYVTQCLAWRKTMPNAITSREIQLLLNSIPYDILKEVKPDGIIIQKHDIVHTITGLNEINRVTLDNADKGRVMVFEVCPGGCIMGGGQPIGLDNSFQKILLRRSTLLKQLIQSW